MEKRKITYAVIAIIVVAAAFGLMTGLSGSGSETTVSALARETHFHGIAVDSRDASRIYLATHHGVFTIAPNGSARLVSENRDDFMGFTPHPADPSVLFASGHPARGGNLGFIASTDGGRTWSKLSDGIGGPVDFHQMDVSKADPKVIYGVYGGLQKSVDGGRSWTGVAPAPQGLIDLATSSRDPNTLYAATQQGLFKSSDGGRSWAAAHVLKSTATMVHVTGDGEIYAFVAGSGLIRAVEQDLQWRVVSNGFGDDYVLHLAAALNDNQRLYVVTINPQSHAQTILASRDGGSNWAALGSE